MPQDKLNRLLPVGLVMPAAGLLFRNFAHGHFSNFGAGFMIGISLVFMILDSSACLAGPDRKRV
jgi:hypothetical protein